MTAKIKMARRGVGSATEDGAGESVMRGSISSEMGLGLGRERGEYPVFVRGVVHGKRLNNVGLCGGYGGFMVDSEEVSQCCFAACHLFGLVGRKHLVFTGVFMTDTCLLHTFIALSLS